MISHQKKPTGKDKPLFLFSALDWGLGHTTRSIPLIKELLHHRCDVIVACNSTQKAILEPEFSQLRFVELEGYGVRYGKTRSSTRLRLLLQLPDILIKVKKEISWLRSFLAENRVDAVISDNRYGLYTTAVPCVFITHQLYVPTGYGAWADRIVQRILYRYINRFSECWVPDFQENGIAGILSHPQKLPGIPVQYLGCLSRLQGQDSIDAKYDLLFILSGPEPQRTILEKKIISELKTLRRSVVIIRGLPGAAKLPEPIAGANIINHASIEALNELVNNCSLVICRSGYTTIMDMLKLCKKMVVIPTPGQPEQEYLAQHLIQNKLAVMMPQEKFSISSAEKSAAAFDYQFRKDNMELYKKPIKQFVAKFI